MKVLAVAMTVYGIAREQVNTRINHKICVWCGVKVRIFLFLIKIYLESHVGSHKLSWLGFIVLSYDVVEMNF